MARSSPIPRVHVIGAGLAGLAASVRLAETGYKITLYEAGPVAGGRCRSYFDETLGCRLDNGNHLLMSGNRAAITYLKTIGAAESLVGPTTAHFPFIDLSTGERWVLAPNNGPFPFWIFDPQKRVPGSTLLDYLSGLRFALCGKQATVTDLVGRNHALFRRFWEPLAVAALNTAAAEGAAHLLWPVLRETFGKGAAFCRPLVAREGLSESFIDPALAWLALKGGRLMTGARVRSLGLSGDRVVHLDIAGTQYPVEPHDYVVVATPAPITAGLLPGLTVPDHHSPIVNAHFRLDHAISTEPVAVQGVVGGLCEWIFVRGPLLSVTISAATHAVDEAAENLAPRIWAEVARAQNLGDMPCPPWRIVKEKRATFAQTPADVARRPGTQTRWSNVALAGDWTNTGLPATIEGAIRSGNSAAQYILCHPQ